MQGALDDVLFGEFRFKRVLVIAAAALSVHHIITVVPGTCACYRVGYIG
jgi:hypothetical protein